MDVYFFVNQNGFYERHTCKYSSQLRGKIKNIFFSQKKTGSEARRSLALTRHTLITLVFADFFPGGGGGGGCHKNHEGRRGKAAQSIID